MYGGLLLAWGEGAKCGRARSKQSFLLLFVHKKKRFLPA
jgi:hypothetical protein